MTDSHQLVIPTRAGHPERSEAQPRDLTPSRQPRDDDPVLVIPSAAEGSRPDQTIAGLEPFSENDRKSPNFLRNLIR